VTEDGSAWKDIGITVDNNMIKSRYRHLVDSYRYYYEYYLFVYAPYY